MASATSTLPVLVAGGGIGGLAAALALVKRGFAVTVLEQSPEIGEIGAGIQLGPNAFSAFDALGVGERARGPCRLYRLHGDARCARRALRRPHPHRRGLPRALRQPVCGDPPRRRAPLAARRRAGVRPRRVPHLDACRARRAAGRPRHRLRPAGQDLHRTGARRRRRREVGGARAVRGRPGARHRPRRLPRGRRQEGLPGRAAMECGQHLGRSELPPRALPAAWRRAVQRRRHLPQPRGRAVGRHRRQPRGGAELLPGHPSEATPVDRPAQELEALGHRRPRADRQLDFRPCHAAR